jgi:transposase-like protein
MTKREPRDAIYRRRRFSGETIELCVRWYLTYRLSYRDLAAMMAERGIAVSHTTILRWVLRFVPEYERRWGRYARPPGLSWRMDETAVNVRGGRHYLYRAVDKVGKSIASLLTCDRGTEAAQEFFRAAVAQEGVPWPTKINLDGNSATHRGLQLLSEEDSRWQSVEIRTCRYLNNIVEQDHRAIKQRCAPMLGLKSFCSAAITLAGIELAHRVRKKQLLLPIGGGETRSSLKSLWDHALHQDYKPAANDQAARPSMHQISGSARRHATNAENRRMVGFVIRANSHSARAFIC